MIDGDWKYLNLDKHEFFFNIAVDARERAMPDIPEDANNSLVYTPATMATSASG